MDSIPHTDWPKLHGEHFAGARVLITGGAGFIGSHLSAALSKLGADVVVLDDLSSGKRENLTAAGSRTTLIEGSILDAALVANAAKGCRYIFHQAAVASVPLSVEKPRLFDEVNGRGTVNVLEAARFAGAQRVMFAASSSAYGDSETLPKVESMPALGRSPYAATKLYGEQLVRAYAASYGLDGCALRYFNIFGPRQTPDSAYAAVIAAFAKALARGAAPRIDGDGEQSRDFTYVDNAVHANLLAARRDGRLQGEVVNVGCGRRVTVNELATKMADAFGHPDLKPSYGLARAGDVRHSLADLTRAGRLLGYGPIVDFETGLRATVAWYREALT